MAIKIVIIGTEPESSSVAESLRQLFSSTGRSEVKLTNVDETLTHAQTIKNTYYVSNVEIEVQSNKKVYNVT